MGWVTTGILVSGCSWNMLDLANSWWFLLRHSVSSLNGSYILFKAVVETLPPG